MASPGGSPEALVQKHPSVIRERLVGKCRVKSLRHSTTGDTDLVLHTFGDFYAMLENPLKSKNEDIVKNPNIYVKRTKVGLCPTGAGALMVTRLQTRQIVPDWSASGPKAHQAERVEKMGTGTDLCDAFACIISKCCREPAVRKGGPKRRRR